MTRLLLIALSSALVFATTAHADGRGTRPAQTRADSASRATSSLNTAEVVHLELVGGSSYGHGGLGSYDISVNGELLTVEIEADSRQGSLSLYDKDGNFIVGYVAGRGSAALFDQNGLVDRGTRRQMSLASMEDYGFAAMVLSDPAVIATVLQANGVIPGGVDGPAAMPWWVGAIGYAVYRCLDFEISYTGNSDGSSSTTYTASWDC